MVNPIRPALDRIGRGFTLPQKLGLSIAGFVYVICPFDFDFIPLLGWLDDGTVVYLAFRMWMGPTLPWRSDAGTRDLTRIGRNLRNFANEFVKGLKEGNSPK